MVMCHIEWAQKALNHIARTQNLTVVANTDSGEPFLAVFNGRIDAWHCWDLRDENDTTHFTLWLLDDGVHLLRHPAGAPVVEQLLVKHLYSMPVHREVEFPTV
jgi:hypothetical protein